MTGVDDFPIPDGWTSTGAHLDDVYKCHYRHDRVH